MSEAQKTWNMNDMNYMLDDPSQRVDGITSSYTYFGAWRSAFAMHTEDMDLYSINYLHQGAHKQWYSIPPESGRALEQVLADHFPKCSAFMRHKTAVVSPAVLEKYDIPYTKTQQHAGEFIVTFPYGYHGGFNSGYNVAEATNFATKKWITDGLLSAES